MATRRHPNLGNLGWRYGVFPAPAGSNSKWVAVTKTGTIGADTRAEATAAYREQHPARGRAEASGENQSP